MSKAPSDKPPKTPTEETVAPSVSKPDRMSTKLFATGLSAKQYAMVKRAMLAVARSVSRHSDASDEDAVHEAFVTALSKPTVEPPSSQDEEKFIAYMCTLAKFEALTNRTCQRRQSVREIVSDADIAEMVGVAPSVDAVEARMMLDAAIKTLKPEQRDLLRALYTDDKTVNDVAEEGDSPWTTVDSRHKRILALLRATIQGIIAALVLLVPKKARAFVAHVMQGAPHLLVPATHLSAAMTVAAVCGVLLPTGSSAMAEPVKPGGLTAYSNPQPATAQGAGLEPSFFSEVEPEEPKVLDTETNQCSAADMKSTKVASFLHETLVPLAFVVAPALTQVACAGTAQQTPPARQTEEEAEADRKYRFAHYEAACDQLRLNGHTCPTFEEWDKQ
jgi:RNA polymerase sigma factor (sigma-70 family)